MKVLDTESISIMCKTVEALGNMQMLRGSAEMYTMTRLISHSLSTGIQHAMQGAVLNFGSPSELLMDKASFDAMKVLLGDK